MTPEENLYLLRALLSSPGGCRLKAHGGEEALERLREAPGRQPLPTRSGIPECPTSSEPESGDAGNPSG